MYFVYDFYLSLFERNIKSLNIRKNRPNFYKHHKLKRKTKKERKREFYKALNDTLLHVSFRSFAMKCLVYSCMRYKISRTNRPEEKTHPLIRLELFATICKRTKSVHTNGDCRKIIIVISFFWLAQSSISVVASAVF